MQDGHTAVQDLERYAAGQLDGIEWVTVHAHVQECAECGQVAAQVPQLAGTSGRTRPVSGPEPAPAEVRPPGWAVVAGTAAVVALVAFAIGHALGTG